jgi:uncharacterized protein YutE (UPF0331/DUF86 family)
MTKIHLESDIILKRISGIQSELADLQQLKTQTLSEFSSGTGHQLAELHLHHCLEGVFNISSHLISRLPGGVATQYKEIAAKMGELGLVPADFAQTKLVEMAKYRNRLVHFYAEITPPELYQILQNDLSDFDAFLGFIKQILENPSQFGFIIN